jgi:DNA polymerase-3 subunit epsilon
MEYVAIDFQTANRWHKSACSVALATVKDGKIIDTFYSLIRPGILHFDKENTALHGITKEMVKDAPYFDELWPLIKEKINGKTLVAHYAKFDMDVLAEELAGNELAFPSCPVFCTCVLSQAMFPEMPHHRLQDVTDKIGFNLEQRYNAMAHARACVAIVEYALKATGAEFLQDVADAYHFHLGYIGKDIVTDCELKYGRARAYDSDFKLQRSKPITYSDMDNKEYLKYWGTGVVLMLSNKLFGSFGDAAFSIGYLLILIATILRFKDTQKPWLYGVLSISFTLGILGFFDVGRAPKK